MEMRDPIVDQLDSYIAACKANLAKYQQIEDPVDRERAITFCKDMIKAFEEIKEG